SRNKGSSVLNDMMLERMSHIECHFPFPVEPFAISAQLYSFRVFGKPFQLLVRLIHFRLNFAFLFDLHLFSLFFCNFQLLFSLCSLLVASVCQKRNKKEGTSNYPPQVRVTA